MKENLGDSYIKALLTGNTTIKRADIPPELIEIKRKQVLLDLVLKIVMILLKNILWI